ncbi:hypothetical protein G7054_g13929 [Neopestalotiopsis clavispora]|nr:hypothetical protein G7054_g13929 [Neopestalotiopsis clavispora]
MDVSIEEQTLPSTIEEQTLPPTSNDALSTLRELSIRCRELLQQLSARNGTAEKAETEGLATSFNIWMANMGVFREGRQSLESRLRSAPQTSELVRQLLMVLKRDLDNKVLQFSIEADSSENDSDSSSDRSTTYRLHTPSDDDDVPPSANAQPTLWSSIEDTLTNLRQLALTVHWMGTQHRQARIERFKNLEPNKQVYNLFYTYAQQRINNIFPNASQTLKERAAESIGTRRARFMYLMQHQTKTSKYEKPSPAPQRNDADEEEDNALNQDHVIDIPTSQHVDQQPSVRVSLRTSAGLSNTTVTGLDPSPRTLKRAESVTSITASVGELPSRPKIAPGASSFTCPYCFLVFPANEFIVQNQWMNHLIHDFEPFFCVIDDCSVPFSCADTYTAWIFHMQAVDDPLRPTSIKYSKTQNQQALQECPFCGGFPEEIETKYPTRYCDEANEALEKHVRDHLISVAMILAPVGLGESGDEIRDLNSEAASDIGSERDLDGDSDTHELECEDPSCDCKDISKNSLHDRPKSLSNYSPMSESTTQGQSIPLYTSSVESTSPEMPPTPVPASDPKLRLLGQIGRASSEEIFRVDPIEALKLLAAGTEALVRMTGDNPPSPPPSTHTDPYMRSYQQEMARIARKFYSKAVPPISIEEYLMRIHRWCPMSTAVYLTTSFYLFRLGGEDKAIPITPRNSHRFLLAGLRVAMKALEDLSYPHAKFAKVAGVSESEVARLEISFCFLMNFELHIRCEQLETHWESLKRGAIWNMKGDGKRTTSVTHTEEAGAKPYENETLLDEMMRVILAQTSDSEEEDGEEGDKDLEEDEEDEEDCKPALNSRLEYSYPD